MANAAPTDLSQIHNDLSTSGVVLRPDQSLAVTGITAPNDLVQAFTLTTSYATSAVTGAQRMNLTGIGSLSLMTKVTDSTTLILVGSLDGNVFTQSLLGTVRRTSVQGSNGPPISNSFVDGYIYDFDTTGLMAVEIRAATAPATTGATGIMRANATTNMVKHSGPVSVESINDTFHISAQNLIPTANATDICMFGFSGSTAKGNVHEVHISGVATAAAYVDYQIVKSTTQDTGGTSTNMNVSAHFDTNDSFQFNTMIAKQYSANPTLGSSRTVMYVGRLFIPAVGTPVQNPGDKLLFGDDYTKAIKIRGTEQLSISLLGNTLPAGLSLNVNMRVTGGGV